MENNAIDKSSMEYRVQGLLAKIESGDIKGFLKEIDEISASKVYLIIRDSITSKHIKAIKDSGSENYQLFQDIKLRAKKSWDYDHSVSTMEDVNRACMNLYTIVLRLMRAQNDDVTSELNKIHSAINRIEEKVGLEPTVWEDQDNSNDNGGNDNVSDVQGVEKNS